MRIVVLNYLCAPGRGSEHGAGWGMLRALRQCGSCTVITAPESGAALAAWNDDHPEEEVAVEIIPEPSWAPFAKRARVGEFLTYLAWQRSARAELLRSKPRASYDVACHVTLSAFWLPSITTDLGIPSVWGPVGGAVVTPTRLWPLLGRRGIVVEFVDWIAVRIMSLFPVTRRTWRSATVRIAQNTETVGRLPADLRSDTIVLNHALFHDIQAGSDRVPPDLEPYVAWVSPMESRKGPELAIRALASTSDDIRLVMVGDGPEQERMQRLARDLGVERRITFTGRVPHDTALATIRDATVAVFTGLREEGGLALAEAMLLGTPVVVLGHGGADVIARSALDPSCVTIVQPTSLEGTVTEMGKAIEDQYRRSNGQAGRARPSLVDTGAAAATLRRALSVAVGDAGHGQS